MVTFRRNCIGALTAIALVGTVSTRCEAATVKCNIHASLGYYKVELFRVGDPYPTRQDYNVRIDGGYIMTYPNVSTGDWFVRATLMSDYNLTGQGPSGHVTSWFPWTEWIPDCWVRP